MFDAMAGPLTVAIALAVVLMVAAILAEGRARHIMRLMLGIRSREDLDQVLAPVPRGEGDWELVRGVDSQPDRPAPGTRAAAWAADAATKATHAVSERASALAQRDEANDGAPRTGELGLAPR